MRTLFFFKFINGSQQVTATIYRHNASYCFSGENNKDLFFSTLTGAIKHALDNDYFIENLFDSVDSSRLRDSKR